MDNTSSSIQASGANGSIMNRGRTMMAQFQTTFNQPGVRRAIPAMALLAAAVFAIFIYTMLGEQNKATLYSGMPEAEKSRALDVLTAAGITAEIDTASGKLTVLQTDFHRARMILAAEGLPQGIPDGYSVINDMPMGTSRSVESARLRQMQELELARSISELDSVSSARVHLALPEKSAFVRDTKPPSASVVLQIKPGHTMDDTQVNAIVSLVATSVPEMARSNVSVVDHTGRLLSSMSDDPIQNLSDQQMKHRLRMEALFRTRIEALITPIVGVGNAAIEVTLDMDFTRSEVTSEQYNPDATALRSEQQMREENSNPSARGIPGAVSNTPPTDATLTDTAPDGVLENGEQLNKNLSSSSTKNYEVSRRVETTIPASAKIERVNAAVLLRSPAEGTPAYSEEFLIDIKSLTQSAIGFNEERGDTITVSSRHFARPEVLPDLPWYETAWMSQAGRQVAQLLALAIIILGIVRPILNRVLLNPADPMQSEPAFTTAVEVAEGESLNELQEKLDSVMEKGVFENNITYDDKIALIRHLAEKDTAKISVVFQNMIDAAEDSVQ